MSGPPDEHVRRLVAGAPPLTAAQRRTLAALLAPRTSDGHPVSPPPGAPGARPHRPPDRAALLLVAVDNRGVSIGGYVEGVQVDTPYPLTARAALGYLSALLIAGCES
jgi:hypothetical protein